MARFQIGDDMPEYGWFEDFYDSSSLALTTSETDTAVFEDGNGARIVLHGAGFVYDGGRITAGTVTGVDFLDENGGTLITVTEGNYNAASVSENLGTGDDDLWGFMTALTAGDDSFHGTDVGNDLNLGDNHGDDLIVAGTAGSYMSGSEGVDVMKGGDGWDTISYRDTHWRNDDTQGIRLDASKGKVIDSWGDRDKFDSRFEEFDGSVYADKMKGSGRDEAFMGVQGADKIDGGKGWDDVRYHQDQQFEGDHGIVADLAKGKIKDGFGTVDKVRHIEAVVGTYEDDVFKGDGQENQFRGLSGVDSFNGRGGTDQVDFNWWEDLGQHGVDVDLTLATGQIKDDGFGNVETVTSIEALSGSNFADKLKLGTAGGWAWGGDGDDILTAGIAGDWLGGSSGSDMFVFETLASVNTPGKHGTHSYIDDFSQQEGDLIDFSAIGVMSFIGTAAFSNVAGELRYEFDDGNTFLQGDMDGNGKADLTLELGGEIDLVVADLVLA